MCLLALSAEHGPESVVFASVSPSTSAIEDCIDWIQRLQRAFGGPNFVGAMELCGWGRYLASLYTYGASVPGEYMPDLDGAECILFWGYNPALSRLSHATATRAALHRGAKLVVVDPRRTGLAAKADPWLRVRPGTDAALALAIVDVMIERGWYEEAFVAVGPTPCSWSVATLAGSSVPAISPTTPTTGSGATEAPTATSPRTPLRAARSSSTRQRLAPTSTPAADIEHAASTWCCPRRRATRLAAAHPCPPRCATSPACPERSRRHC